MTMRHFTRLELIRSQIAQDKGIDNTPMDEEVEEALRFTAAGLERVRAYLGWPMIIKSAYRSQELNAAVNGAKDSQHMKGEAVDFICPQFGSVSECMHRLLPAMAILGIDQLIQEPSWIHASFTYIPRYEALRFFDGRYVRVT